MKNVALYLAASLVMAWLAMLAVGAAHSIDPTMPPIGFLNLWVPLALVPVLVIGISKGWALLVWALTTIRQMWRRTS